MESREALEPPGEPNAESNVPCTPQVYSLSEQNRFYKKAAAFVLRAVAKQSPQLAQVRDETV